MGQYYSILKKIKGKYPAALNNVNQFRGLLKDEQCEKSVVKILCAFVEEGIPNKLSSGGCTQNELNRLVKRVKTDNAFDDSVYEAMADFAALYDVKYNYVSHQTGTSGSSSQVSSPTQATSSKSANTTGTSVSVTNNPVVSKSRPRSKRSGNSVTGSAPSSSTASVSFGDISGNGSTSRRKGCLRAVIIYFLLVAIVVALIAILYSSFGNDDSDIEAVDETIEEIVADGETQKSYGSTTGAQQTQKVRSPKVEKITITANGVEFKMVKVKGGTFIMGCDSGDGCDGFVKPAHKVTVSDFYISETEVTQELWKAVMYSNPNNFKGNKYPVDNIRKEEAIRFLSSLHWVTDKDFRLPTEAEWEFAAKGGIYSNHYKYSGSNSIDDVGWYMNNSDSCSHPVASKRPNELGLYDMSGNVWEWCSDWYGDYTSAAQTNPKGPNVGTHYVLRGGGWNRESLFCLSMQRNCVQRYFSDATIGIRIVMEVE